MHPVRSHVLLQVLARAAFAALACLCVAAALAQVPPRSEQHRWREAAAFLQLTPQQWEQLREARANHDRQMNELAGQARVMQTRKDEAGLQQLCLRSKALANAFRDKLRPMFTPAQLQQLAQLEGAFALMPIVQSAQSAGLIADRLTTAPEGLPQEQVVVEASWHRVVPVALPGCPVQATEVRSGVVDTRRDTSIPSSQSEGATTVAPAQKRSPGHEPNR
jgi:hypothetical protein